MNNRRFIPKDKEDLEFIDELKHKSIKEVKDVVPDLLEWLQDMNWPQAKLLADYFSPYINEIDVEIVDALEGNDDIWKYSLLLGLILNSKTTPNNRILSTVARIYNSPTQGEKDEGVDVLASEIIKKYYKK